MLFAAYILLAAYSVASTTLYSAMEDIGYESIQDKKRKRELEDENRPLMKNLFFLFPEGPQSPLGPHTNRWNKMKHDENRQYCKKLTHMFSWEILRLFEMCKNEIAAPRETSWRAPPKKILKEEGLAKLTI